VARIIGIDLGTTNSLVAVLEADGPRVLTDPQTGARLLPSAVAFQPDGDVVVGARARELAGERPLDTILSVNGTKINDSRDLARQIATFSPGTKVEVKVLRAQREQTIGVTLGSMPTNLELAKADSLKPTTSAMSDAEIMQAIGAPGVPPEGRFFPDTYAYSKGSADVAVLSRAYRAMQRRLESAWAERTPDTPLRSADEALTLASIVEKETGRAEDRSLVAGVFVNRLRSGMPLQTDPSVIYGLGEAFDGNLRKRDLQADTPYNTYLRAGLPPTPIAMPGKDALMATVRPAATKALYFVARGDGASVFSESLADHNRAVNKFQRGTARNTEP